MATTQLDCVLHHVRKLVGVRREADLTDGELLGRFLDRQDEAAFATVVRRHGPMVQRVCRRVLNDAHAAEDAFQATFLVLARKAAAIRQRDSLGGWLYEVAYHLAVRARADVARRCRHERQAVDMWRNTDPGEDREAMQAVIDEELHRLPEKYRTPLVLCYLEGKTNVQAAHELGWPAGSMSSRLAHAREMLRDRLLGRGVALSSAGMTALLGANNAPAAVPAALVHNTVQAALLFAAGKTSVAGIVSAQAVVLAEGMVHTMISTKLKLVAVVLLAVGLLGSGTSALVQRSVLAEVPGVAERRAEVVLAVADVPKADAFGDALPDGALARMGTLRWRHGAAVTFVAYMTDGKQLVTASQDGLFRVWDAGSGKEVRRFGNTQPNQPPQVAPGGAVRQVAMLVPVNTGAGMVLSPDGQTLAVVGGNGTVQLWETATGKDVRTVEHKGLISVAFLPDSKSLATRDSERKIKMWEVATGKEVHSVQLARAEEPKLIPDATAELKLVLRRGGDVGSTVTMAFSADGKLVVTLGTEGNQRAGVLQISDAATGQQLHKINAPANAAAGGMAITADGKTLAWADTNGMIRLFETETAKEVRQVGQQQQFVSFSSLAFSPDGKILAGQANNGPTIRLWDVASGKELPAVGEAPAPQQGGNAVFVRRFGGSSGSPTFAFSPDGKVLAEGTPHHTVRLWDVATGKEIPPASGHQGGVSLLSVSPDGKVLTTHGADNTVRQWDMTTGKELRQFKLPAGAGRVLFAADGKTVVVPAGNAVQVLDAASGKEVNTIAVANQGRQGGVSGLAISPDGKTLAMRGFDQTIRLFDTTTGKETAVMSDAAPGGGGAATSPFMGNFGASPVMVFSPDGSMLATLGNPAGAGQPGAVVISRVAPAPVAVAIQLWNVARAKKARQFDTAERSIQSLVFAPDGRTIVTSNGDNTVSLWESITGKECLNIKLTPGQAAQPNPPPPPGQAVVLRTGVVGPTAATSIAIAADGRTLAVSSADRTIGLFDLTTGSELGRFKGHEGNVLSVAFAPDSRTVISGSLDTTAMVWDGGRFIKKETPAVSLTSAQVESLWNDLAATPKEAFKAIVTLSTAPKESATLLRERVKPAQGVEAKRIDQLVMDLDSKEFAVRQKATDELEKLGELAEPALQKMLATQPALETRQRIERLLEQQVGGQIASVDVLRSLRAVRVLEQVGTPEARQVLQTLAGGAPGDKLTREAEIALKRLAK